MNTLFDAFVAESLSALEETSDLLGDGFADEEGHEEQALTSTYSVPSAVRSHVPLDRLQ